MPALLGLACVCAHLRLPSARMLALSSALQVRQLGKDLFKSLVAAYRQQPQAQADTYKSGERGGDSAAGATQQGCWPA